MDMEHNKILLAILNLYSQSLQKKTCKNSLKMIFIFLDSMLRWYQIDQMIYKDILYYHFFVEMMKFKYFKLL